MRRVLRVLLALLMIASFVVTSSPSGTALAAKKVPASSVYLEKKSATIYVGDKYTINAQVRPSNASSKALKYTSSNKKIASVSAEGVVTAKKAGKAKITAKTKVGAKRAVLTITVKAVKPKSVTLNVDESPYIAKVGEKLKLKATVLPANATNKAVTYVSSKKSVATVSAKGVVTMRRVGTAKITAKTKVGGKKATLTVKVQKKIEPTSVKLTASALTVGVGKTIKTEASVIPARAENKTVSFSSGNTSVASVDKNGVVTGIKEGTARIWVKTASGGRSAYVDIRVTNILPTSISMSQTELTLEEGQIYPLSASVLPADATDKTIKYTSGDARVVTVSDAGLLIAKAKGTATVTAVTTAGGVRATCKITVYEKVYPVTDVSLNHQSYSLTVGGSATLAAQVFPANATDKTVLWSSDNASVASVSSAGEVRANAVGTARIYATSKSGGFTAECSVTVSQVAIVPSSVTLSESALTLGAGSTSSISATVLPANATDKTLTWTSDNPAIARVSESGVVTAVSKGKTTIRVKTNSGKKQAACSVTVADLQPKKTALLIGQSRYKSGTLDGPANDVELMSWVLRKSGYTDIKILEDLTAGQIDAQIRALSANGGTAEDVTFFYYSGHGLSSTILQNKGALCGVDGSFLTVDSVRQGLDLIPGQIIAVFDSCLSGQYIASKSFGAALITADADAFNRSVINAFSQTPSIQSKSLTDSPVSGKYKILTASESVQNSYSAFFGSSKFFGVMTYSIGTGMGIEPVSGAYSAAKADTNGDKRIALKELYDYVDYWVAYYVPNVQDVQVWPSNCAEEILSVP